MAQYQILRAGIVVLGDSSLGTAAQVRCGSKTTRATVYAEENDGFNSAPIGSLYLSNDGSTGKLYVKVAGAGASTDWQKATTTAAD